MALSISAETSPVKAPDFSQWQFCAATPIAVPLVASRAAGKSTKGTPTTTSQEAPATRGFKSLMSAVASAGVLFIFQLPAMTYLRIVDHPFHLLSARLIYR